MSDKKNIIKPVIVTVVNPSEKKSLDFFSTLAAATGIDQSYLRQIIKGKRNISLDVLQSIASAYNMRYIMMPVPESKQLKRLIANHAEEKESYWRVSVDEGYNAIYDFLLNAAQDKGNFKNINRAAYMFNAILARAAWIKGSEEEIIKILSTGTEELMDIITRSTEQDSETEQENP